MKQRLKNQNGTTLVELIVCMVLLAIFTLAAVTLIQPSAQAYMDIQQQTRAQNLADALIETIRGEVLEANGYSVGIISQPDWKQRTLIIWTAFFCPRVTTTARARHWNSASTPTTLS